MLSIILDEHLLATAKDALVERLSRRLREIATLTGEPYKPGEIEECARDIECLVKHHYQQEPI